MPCLMAGRKVIPNEGWGGDYGKAGAAPLWWED